MLVGALAVALWPSTALADGDPASDVLLIQNVYTPYQPPTPATQALLRRAVGATFGAKYPIQVALIRERADLGAVPDFFGRPQEYAKFLYSELRRVKPRNYGLLVVMPAGYGVYGPPRAQAGSLRSLSVSSSSDSDQLANAAVLGLQQLAKSGGHPIPQLVKPPTTGGGGLSAGVVVLIAEILLTLLAVGFGLRWRMRRRDAAGAGAAGDADSGAAPAS
jgi:hypothetical protein